MDKSKKVIVDSKLSKNKEQSETKKGKKSIPDTEEKEVEKKSEKTKKGKKTIPDT